MLSVVTNIEEVAKQIQGDARDQVPFAIALALTRTAQDVQRELQATLGDYFTTRGTWVGRSMKIDKAKKGPAPEAVAGSVYAPMALHTEGGEKSGRGGDDVAVPIAARADPAKRTTPATWPGALAKRGDFFLAPFGGGVVGAASDGSGGIGLFQRVGRDRDRKRLKLWWLLEPEVQIKPTWPFDELARDVVERELVDNLWSAMEQALATRRR